MNIMDMLKDQLGSQIAGKLGGALGESEDATKGAMDGMLGSILGGILGKASTPQGADDLSKQLDQHDGGLLDSIGDIFGGDKQEEVASSGTSILGSLFGDKLGGIGDLLGGASGMKSGSILKMLGMLAPLVMGFLGKMKKSQGLDAGGFASMLMSQKENIGSAMPDGMTGALGLSDNLFSKAGAAATDAAQSAKSAVSGAASNVASEATAAAKEGGSILKLLIPLILLVAAGYMGYVFMTAGSLNQDPDGSEATARPKNLRVAGAGGGPPRAAAPEATGFAAIEGLGDMAGQFKDIFSGAEDTLVGIEDEAGATAAVTKLGELTESLGGMSEGFGGLPDAAKTGVVAYITEKVLPRLVMAFDKAKEVPGVEAILKPAIDAMMEKVKSFGA
ncbi:MAG: DUF937 domain-containing protein [Planctomycetaceae bacterium]